MQKLLHFFLLFLLSSSLNAATPELEQVRLQLQWKHQFEFAGFYAAKEMGYYEDVGLEVSFLELDNSKSITQRVIDGDAEYAVNYSSLVIDYYEDKPLVFIANFFKRSPLVLVTHKYIKTPKDLIGKTIMGLNDTGEFISIESMLNKFGVQKSDYSTLKTNFKIDAFRENKVDAISVFSTNELYTLQKLGIEYKVFDPNLYEMNSYDVNLFTTTSELATHPQRVENFRQASIKGWEYALRHKSELVEIILAKYNTQYKSREALMFEARQIEALMLSDIYPIGSIDKKRVRAIVDKFKQAGFIDTKKYKNLDELIFVSKTKEFSLSKKEQEYLKGKKSLKVCVDPQWMPFGSLKDGKYIGIDADFMKILEDKIPNKIEIYKTKTREESIMAVQKRKCDFISLVVNTKEHEKYLNLTSSYLNYPLVIVTKTDKKHILDVRFLTDEKVAIVKGYSEMDYIKKNYPNLIIVEVESVTDGVKYVKDGKVYGFVDNAYGVEYYFQNTDYSDLKISAHFNESFSLSYGVPKGETELYRILEKVVLGISDSQRTPILKEWFSYTYKKQIDYMYYFKIFIVLAVVLLFFVVRHYNIKQLNRELKRRVEEELEKSKSKDKMLFLQNKHTSMGEMMGNIAHQWRQPLTQINSAVLVLDDVLEDLGVDNEVVEAKLEEIESLTMYMSKTISDFRNFYDTDKDKESFMLQVCIDEAVSIVSSSLKSNNIELLLSGSSNQACYGYPSELKQVIVVLLNNARDVLILKKVQKAKIVISISVNLTIKICDNGGGVDSKIVQRIFEPYFTTKHKSQGTGLGLYIAKLIVEDSLGGKLSVNNSHDGACFNIGLKGVQE